MSIKHIAKIRLSQLQNGVIKKLVAGKSVFWYDQWLATNEKSIVDDIINYNEDDVRATERLHIYILELRQANPHGNRLDS